MKTLLASADALYRHYRQQRFYSPEFDVLIPTFRATAPATGSEAKSSLETPMYETRHDAETAASDLANAAAAASQLKPPATSAHQHRIDGVMLAIASSAAQQRLLTSMPQLLLDTPRVTNVMADAAVETRTVTTPSDNGVFNAVARLFGAPLALLRSAGSLRVPQLAMLSLLFITAIPLSLLVFKQWQPPTGADTRVASVDTAIVPLGTAESAPALIAPMLSPSLRPVIADLAPLLQTAPQAMAGFSRSDSAAAMRFRLGQQVGRTRVALASGDATVWQRTQADLRRLNESLGSSALSGDSVAARQLLASLQALDTDRAGSVALAASEAELEQAASHFVTSTEAAATAAATTPADFYTLGQHVEFAYLVSEYSLSHYDTQRLVDPLSALQQLLPYPLSNDDAGLNRLLTQLESGLLAVGSGNEPSLRQVRELNRTLAGIRALMQ